MKGLIYYPNFESTDETWLKYALIYIDELSSIIPLSGIGERSDLYRKLENETDLLSIYKPKYLEGLDATDITLSIIERIHKCPQAYAEILHHVNAPRVWQDQSQQTYKLYQEKYSLNWEMFCLENDYARKGNGGLLISEQLGSLYMSVLAQTIADKSSKSIITDDQKVENLTFFLKSKDISAEQQLQCNAKAVVNLLLPENIENIPLNKIIALRNRNGFKEYQNAFANALENFYKNIEGGQTNQEFINKYTSSFSDFNENILSLSLSTVSFGLGTYLMLSNEHYSSTEIGKQITDVLQCTLLGGYSLAKTFETSGPKRKCRRFITNLKKIK